MRRLTVWAGPVLSDKSTRAIGRASRLTLMGKRVICYRPVEAVRDHERPGELRTRSNATFPSTELATAHDLRAAVYVMRQTGQPLDVVWVDEPALFVDEEHLYDIVQEIRQDTDVMISGTPATSEMEPFGASFPRLIAVADDVHWCKGDCHWSQTFETASRSVCLRPKTGQRLVGGAETYRPASPAVWTEWRAGRLPAGPPQG